MRLRCRNLGFRVVEGGGGSVVQGFSDEVRLPCALSSQGLGFIVWVVL